MRIECTDQVLAFSPEQVRQLTGLSPRQLQYWAQSGLFSAGDDDKPGPRRSSRIYSFRDLVGLGVLAALRKVFRVPLDDLHKVGAWLAAQQDRPWESLTLYVVGRRVWFDDADTIVDDLDPNFARFVKKVQQRRREQPEAIDTPKTIDRLDGQFPEPTVSPFDLQTVARDMEAAVDRLRGRTAAEIGKVVRHRQVVHNAPILKGTRIPTSAVWNLHSAGYSDVEIVREYPRLTPEDVEAAIKFEEQMRSKRAG